MICGVDAEIVERFLRLIRDSYRKAHKSASFLEDVSGTTYTLITANLRDVLSHLATMLEEETPPEDWEAQVTSAEEHFRRAIQEPYAIAVGKERQKFDDLFEQYRKIYPLILRLQRKHHFFQDAPTVARITSRSRDIFKLVAEGHDAKRRNRMDPDWDHAVASYVEAYDQIEALNHQLGQYIHEYIALKFSRRSTLWTIIGTVGTILFGALSALLIFYPDLPKGIRAWLGLS